jgi:hypothetical protein
MTQWANCRVKSAGADQDNSVRIRLENLDQTSPFDHTFFCYSVSAQGDARHSAYGNHNWTPCQRTLGSDW